ncbi:MAG TPA: hypothetical protein VHV51_08725 [Polyangiaceae bacterium]|jgi:hypothetical protein|nr:hypothetical protein [Polyangiaceae bacterium]
MRGTRVRVSLLAACSTLALVACDSKSNRDVERRSSAVSGAATTTASVAPSATASSSSGCHDNSSCARNEYCEFEPGLCGKGQAPGTCRARPTACPSGAGTYEPVCACSGKVYDNACAAHAAREDLAVMGGCKAIIPDFAACGANYCDAHKSYCEIYLSDVFDLPTDHFCQPLPDACKLTNGKKPSCDCFPKETPCLSFCGPLATGGIDAFHLTCQGKHPKHTALNSK